MNNKTLTVTNGIINNTRCQICGTKSDIVCNECLAIGQLACYCGRHQQSHRYERMHMAYWGALAK